MIAELGQMAYILDREGNPELAEQFKRYAATLNNRKDVPESGTLVSLMDIKASGNYWAESKVPLTPDFEVITPYHPDYLVFQLTDRSRTVLRDARLPFDRSIQHLCNLSDEELLSLKNCGPKVLSNLQPNLAVVRTKLFTRYALNAPLIVSLNPEDFEHIKVS